MSGHNRVHTRCQKFKKCIYYSFLIRQILSCKVPVLRYVFGPPGSGFVSQRYGSGSFYHQTKIVRINFMIPAVL